MNIVGRDQELGAIAAWLGGGASGVQGPPASAPVMVVQGEPGIGKTTVWADATSRARAEGWTVLSCRARPTDSGLSYLGLTDLLRPVADAVFDHLPPPQRRALETAVLRQEVRDSAIEARAVGTGLTGLLAKIEESGPLLIAVDDAQWLDRASVSSLAFAVHRLEELRVRLLTAIRLEGVPARQPWVTTAFESVLGRDRILRMSLGPLSVAAMHRVFQEALGKSFTRPLLLRITTVSGGNPFYALEIAREIERVGDPAPGRPLPVPDDHRELARLRLGRLPRATRDELARIAALSRPMAADLDVHALAPAERAGIVRVQPDGRVDFTHPLFGSVVYASLSEDERRRLHLQLAARVTRVEERGRHLALAADGPDEASARVLDDATTAAAARGASEVAVEMKELALQLTPPQDREAVTRRSLELASRRYLAGDAPGARRELEASLRPLEPGEDRAEVLLELGSVLWNQGELNEGLALVGQALAEASAPSLQARIHSRLASLAEDFDTAVEHAEAALALIDEAREPVTYSFALHNLARSKLYSGRGADHQAIERGMRLQRELSGWEVSTVPAYWARDFDDFATARYRFEEILRVFREQGDEASCSGALAQLAIIEAFTGHLERARHLADDALDFAHQTEQDTWINVALNSQGQVFARAGDLTSARAAAEEVLRRLEAQPDRTLDLMVRAVLGLTALSAGDFAEADRHFSLAEDTLAVTHNREPASDRFHADHAEAVIALGDLDRAEGLIARMEARASAIPRPWIQATSARCRGLLLAARGDLDGALAAVETSLGHHASLDMPFEHARTLLVHGQILRRRNERRASRASLEQALAIFMELGVDPWAERVRAELARVPVRRSATDLTPAEETIARLAASGMINKAIAERAFVSVKTVEANLSRVYEKLGIHSRAELGRVMLERERPAKT